MKKVLILLVVSFFAIQSFGQFTFGVSPGIKLNSAHFGYKVNSKIIPYVGLQHFNVNFTSEFSRDRYSSSRNEVYRDIDLYELSGNLYLPNIGVKYFALQQNKLRAYVSVNFTKPIFFGEIEMGEGNWEDEVEKEFKETVKKINIWGGELGFGVEYFFDDNFSVGGEFGIRHFNLKYESDRDGTYYNPNTGTNHDANAKESIKINSSPTFSKITLNFYFNKKKQKM